MTRTAHDLALAAARLVAHIRTSAIAARSKRKQTVLRLISEAEQSKMIEVRTKALNRFANV